MDSGTIDLTKLDKAKIVCNNVHRIIGPRNEGPATIVSATIELATTDPVQWTQQQCTPQQWFRHNRNCIKYFSTMESSTKVCATMVCETIEFATIDPATTDHAQWNTQQWTSRK